ncbi:co-chaperone GroES [Gammaproteobacteria bacterium]|nr:co-chaperone GroES [Gammaproteobacteria bacterium]
MSKLKLIPRHDRVIIKPQEAEEKTSGGIYIPTQSDQKLTKGEVVALGAGKDVNGQLKPIELKVGQVVVFNAYSATDIEDQGQSYQIIKEEDILAIVE